MAVMNFNEISRVPLWHDHLADAPELPEDLPRQADVVIIGARYTGLSAGITLARGGRSTVIIDAEDPGYSCSSRNGGQVSTSVKPTLEKLAKKFGLEKARAIRGEGVSALNWLADFVAREEIDCDFHQCGRFHAAHTPEHYETLVRDAELMKLREGIESFAVPREDQRTELGSGSYFGGVIFTRHSSVHPAKMLREFLHIALSAGATVIGKCPATRIEKLGKGFRVHTHKGIVEAENVIVATNGYTTNVNPRLRKRVIPIGSYVIATEELPAEVVDELFPTDRIASDTCKVLYYYRATPDRKRIVFGGRVLAAECDPVEAAPHLYKHMCRIFPQLEGYGLSHAWSGTVAYSFDELAHTGVHDGIHYSLGYCGSGASMASYLGVRTGQKVLGLPEGATAFDGIPHPTQLFYTGKPWFLPAAVSYYRWADTR
ncbi:FAD-dependent oxidoreductase [Breoghania sp.]|uniref:NAD(P)/FAD-dependent oxidoreductase n=1 Tax=Breoghania sp. TaxID=2065378 RepID=UPI0026127F2E|nr:FAD-dependent oxidoreductase [Breoghania sp.]MDJ0933407.1 FAD-dependent oxidoreductase [Breoghania sp.]